MKVCDQKSYLVLFICLFGILAKSSKAKGSHKVHCTEDLMRIEIALPSQNDQKTEIYLDGLKGYPDIRCQPIINGSLAEFRLSLKNFYECGVTRMINKITGKKVYYHKIIIESENSNEFVRAKCTIADSPVYDVVMNQTHQYHQIVRRDVLPVGFQEPEELDYENLTEIAPEPMLGVGVRQGGKLVTGELNVSPGTPLTMEIYLYNKSAQVYGLGVTYMEVTDTKSQDETIIFNGCSVDPYLFENFNTIDGDFLTAKFRAFKFPESTYVQFRATVNVCLNKCQGTQCSNGQIGYGKRRKRRSVRNSSDPNKIYEISLATFIKVSETEGINKNEIMELEEKLRQLKLVNQKLPRNSRRSAMETTFENLDKIPNDSVTVVEEKTLLQLASATTATNNSNLIQIYNQLLLISISIVILCFLKN